MIFRIVDQKFKIQFSKKIQNVDIIMISAIETKLCFIYIIRFSIKIYIFYLIVFQSTIQKQIITLNTYLIQK